MAIVKCKEHGQTICRSDPNMPTFCTCTKI